MVSGKGQAASKPTEVFLAHLHSVQPGLHCVKAQATRVNAFRIPGSLMGPHLSMGHPRAMNELWVGKGEMYNSMQDGMVGWQHRCLLAPRPHRGMDRGKRGRWSLEK
jgi:hypothetical protein